MKMYTLTSSIHLPIPIEEAWTFLKNPAQLENITSDDFSLQPIDPLPKEMYEGMLIRYQVKPFFNVPLNWVTEITHIKEKKRFIDVQRFGPFRYWHHEHLLIEKDGGTEMRDILHYVMPFSFFGRIVHRLFVRKKLEAMFEYRQKEITAYFK